MRSKNPGLSSCQLFSEVTPVCAPAPLMPLKQAQRHPVHSGKLQELQEVHQSRPWYGAKMEKRLPSLPVGTQPPDGQQAKTLFLCSNCVRPHGSLGACSEARANLEAGPGPWLQPCVCPGDSHSDPGRQGCWLTHQEALREVRPLGSLYSTPLEPGFS